MASHLASAYRYAVEDEGMVVQPLVLPPRRLTGVTVTAAGPDSTGGLGSLRYDPGPPVTLSWRDPVDEEPGPEVIIEGADNYTLMSRSADRQNLARWITVTVDPLLLPPSLVDELLRVELSERNCVTFTVRNIRLLETASGGQNDVFLYFAQAPQGRLTLPGLFRVAHVPVVYHQNRGRQPPDVLVPVADEEFVPVGY
jgi:hypothetical protein